MYTKGEIVSQAFAELALAGWDWDLTPDEQSWALQRMDMLAAEWALKGIHIGYNASVAPETDLQQPSGVPMVAVRALVLNLAREIAAGKGKALPATTIAQANQAYSTLAVGAALPGQQAMPETLPLGAGNRYWRGIPNPYFPKPGRPPLEVGQGGNLEFLG